MANGKALYERMNSVFVSDHPRPVVDCSVDPVTGEECPAMTRQEFADECDINAIMKRYEKLGVISHVNQAVPTYGDFVDIPDFAAAQEIFMQASDAFARLPARLRADYENDPHKFIDAIAAGKPGDELHDRLRSLGLLEVPEPPPAPAAAAPGEPAKG